jgi:hypothetical protein
MGSGSRLTRKRQLAQRRNPVSGQQYGRFSENRTRRLGILHRAPPDGVVMVKKRES